MTSRIRTDPTSLYRWFFVLLFFVCGGSGLALVLFDALTGIDLLAIESDRDKDALYSILLALGLLGLCLAGTMLYLLRERRDHLAERRARRLPIDFPERRKQPERRQR